MVRAAADPRRAPGGSSAQSSRSEAEPLSLRASARLTGARRLHVTVRRPPWRPRPSVSREPKAQSRRDRRCRRIESACARRAFVRSRSGCPIRGRRRFAAQASRQSRLVASSRYAAEDQAFIDALSSGAMSETRRGLDRCRRQGLRRQAASGRDRAGRSVRRDQLDHDLRLHERPDRRSAASASSSSRARRTGSRRPRG